jgi:hypothetical protein
MKKIIFAGLLLAPSFVFADVRINEVAWMGDITSPDHEWIELYNDSDVLQDLSGWKLMAYDTTETTKEKFSIALTGVISAKGYFLVERKRSASDTAPYLASDFTTVSFSLVNGGETLLLKSDGDSKIDEVRSSFKTKWEKGDNVTKETMQWNGAKWITATATPRAENKTADTSATNTTDDTNTDTTTDTAQTSSPGTTLDTSAHVSPLPLSDFSQKQELYISAGRNRIVSVGSPVAFEAFAIDAKGVRSQNIASVWSFGDGAQGGGPKVTHTYKYPGDYVVVLNANAGGNEAVSRAEVRVFAPKIALGKEEDGSVSLVNDSAYEINIGGWKIVGAGGGGTFVASSDTIIKEGKKLIFPKTVTGIDFSDMASIEFLSPDGAIVASFAKTLKPLAIPMASTTPTTIPPVAEKKIETAVAETDAPLIAVPKPETVNPKTQQSAQSAAVALAVPEKEKPAIVSAGGPGEAKQTIVLKKPEGFFAKIWNFFSW